MSFDQKDKQYWKLGIFYFNPKDKATFIPKRTGLGVTCNFAKPIPIVCAAAFLAAVAAFVVLAIK